MGCDLCFEYGSAGMKVRVKLSYVDLLNFLECLLNLPCLDQGLNRLQLEVLSFTSLGGFGGAFVLLCGTNIFTGTLGFFSCCTWSFLRYGRARLQDQPDNQYQGRSQCLYWGDKSHDESR